MIYVEIFNVCDFEFDIEFDLLKIVVVEWYNGLKEIGFGVVKGFGLKSGVIVIIILYDFYNIIVVGVNDVDIVVVVNKLYEIGGGLMVIKNGEEFYLVLLLIVGLLFD